MSLGQYLQPGGLQESLASQPLSDSEEEEEAGLEAAEGSGGFSWDQVVQANTGEEPPLQQVSWTLLMIWIIKVLTNKRPPALLTADQQLIFLFSLSECPGLLC